ncbi:MAG: pyridoxamine 5'-phosphate oxidase family protein [Candidatus Bathyarchaeota archaeon]|nr:pyridoxamine 5'-phosphate oxidase family protein [Candidatus Bathyarchaeota archaeon]UCD39746.1 MAG: pyridoxamine 5'-phosphate oxidase family protein [Candidatus Bathyarchaeota archaeon]
MNKQEIQSLIREQMLCRIAFKSAEYPYIAPFQYVYINGSIYFHFTDYGRKKKLIETDNRVCVEIESFRPDMSEYNFVVLRGRVKTVIDPVERAAVINRMANDGKEKVSANFLAAHGFKKEDGWSSLSPERPLTILRFEVAEEIGLKSP